SREEFEIKIRDLGSILKAGGDFFPPDPVAALNDNVSMLRNDCEIQKEATERERQRADKAELMGRQVVSQRRVAVAGILLVTVVGISTVVWSQTDVWQREKLVRSQLIDIDKRETEVKRQLDRVKAQEAALGTDREELKQRESLVDRLDPQKIEFHQAID